MDQAAARRLLGLSPGADRAQVEAAFRAGVRTAHPDRGGDVERFLRIVEAREALFGACRPPSGAWMPPGQAPRSPAQVQFVPSSSLLHQVVVFVARRLVEGRRGQRSRRVV